MSKKFVKAYYRGLSIWAEEPFTSDFEGILEPVYSWLWWWVDLNIWIDSKLNWEGFPIIYANNLEYAPEEINEKICKKYNL